MGTPNLYDLAAEIAANTKRAVELLESRSAPGWVEVPKSRLAELERIESDFAAMREDRDAFQAKVADAESLARECARIAWFSGQLFHLHVSLHEHNVDCDSLIARSASDDEGQPGDIMRSVLAKARERLSARASAKPEPDKIHFRVGPEHLWVPSKPAKPEPAPDDGAFKSYEEDSELVAMGILLDCSPESECPVGAVSLFPTPATVKLVTGNVWEELGDDDTLSVPVRKTLRRVRRERAERPADADAP